ncbi:MAG: glycosyltransferase family A protein [Bacteroidota bacterium]|nr:glycosyltransferase family A protein [Bacteroidota bacterium]
MISIIITTYNYGKYLERAIRSCMEQSMSKKEFEILVIDDASTDYTSDILKNYQDEIIAYSFEENKGLSYARNFGIKKAKGQFVVFLDADDYIHRDLLLIESRFLLENNLLDAVSCDYFLVDERGERIRHVNAEIEPIACGIMFRKDLLYDINMYDEKFLAREEEDLRKRFLSKYNIYNLIIPLYRYRRHNENLTNNLELMNEFKNRLDNKHQNE